MEMYWVYMTTENKSEARSIGRMLVESKLAACVNIIDHMNSLYMWQDKLQDDLETVLIAKTSPQLVSKLIDTVKELHSYECPCILSWPVSTGNPDFIKWIHAEVASE
jgi:periplasmic divalent cation tolerance protein